MLKKFYMAYHKPLSTPISHRVTMCRNDGAEIIDEISYKNIVGNLMFLFHTRSDACNQLQPYNKILFRIVFCGSI